MSSKPTASKKKPTVREQHTKEVVLLEQTLQVSREEVAELGRKLKASYRANDLFASLADIITTETKPLPKLQFKVQQNVKTGTADLVLILSDEHADEVISSPSTWGMEEYDFNVFRIRLQRLFEQIVQYSTKHLSAHAFERLWILKLGDSVHGDIHGSSHRNYFKNTLKASLAVGDVEAQFVQSLVPYFVGGVHVVAVSGNHPRRSMRKDYGGPHDNFDYLVVTQMATRLEAEIKEGHVTVYAPEAWTAFVEIRGHIWCLNHGDDVQGYAGYPWYGFDRKNNRVQSLIARMDQRVDFFTYGHYHTEVTLPSAGALSVHNGAFTMTEPFALNKISASNPPTQRLVALNEEHGRILEIPIFVRDEKREAQFKRGEFTPKFGTQIILDKVTPKEQIGFQLHKVEPMNIAERSRRYRVRKKAGLI